MPFFDGLGEFFSSGPVLSMDGEGVIKDGCKLIGATVPQKSKPGATRGDFAIVVGRYTHYRNIYNVEPTIPIFLQNQQVITSVHGPVQFSRF
ncbi:putative nucleoside-diphosphate kinase [Helianthus annuus]|nr:putative nucleoside-diphosphate kinase [Helianthus annuus]KAJ0515856.1 putative nucleoside-diphosphate kinase [Helianthus annuus]KAJ0683873.1 putative nucleoside-diphosphate kinase [Helianthus annuus]KAJ0687835.1 putative nucleoside-diphosphate kinase [Helianthus annuus]KAJ0868843.1 putative nucleoside-diphosphate kinase [Helianthus annuus]